MTQGLGVSDVVNVQVDISPTAAPFLGFGNAIIIGSSPIIDVGQRTRLYAGGTSALAAIATDFGTTSPEYYAADLFFSQVPQPSQVYIGRWAQTATSGLLRGATLTAAQAALSNFTSVTNGGFVITIDGTSHTVSGLNFSAAQNLNAVAADVQAELPSGVTVVWNPIYNRFTIVSSTTGTSSNVSYASSPASGTDVSTLLGLTAASGAGAPVAGIAAESLLSAVTTLSTTAAFWYAGMVATVTPPADSDNLAVAAYVEGLGNRLYGITLTNTEVLDPTQTGDLASQLMALGYKRTFSQYCSSNPYAVASYIGRFITVDFTAQNSVLTMKFKQEPGVAAETLTESQAAALAGKNVNGFVNYANGTAIIQQGVQANGYFTDEVQNLDWLANQVQTNMFNVLYQATTKVPQTDAGVGTLKNAAIAACAQGNYNGTLAEGQWNSTTTFGSLTYQAIVPNGYYVYAPPVSSQNQTDREARKAPTLQIAAKLAGAVHFASAILNVNR